VGGRWGWLYDRLVFSKIRAKLGGELKYMISGAAGYARRRRALRARTPVGAG
jgi:long-subunit acyl-CoA synthetase (AMP-forming)